MIRIPIFLLTLSLFGPSVRMLTADEKEAHASFYVVDFSGETEGSCTPYKTEIPAGPGKEILAIAKGPPGSVILMIAFQNDELFANLPPILAAQTAESKPVRFPPAESIARWTYEKSMPGVELFVATFDQSHPHLGKITESVSWLREALAEGDSDTAMLQSLEIKNRLTEILREQGAQDFQIKFGESFPELDRVEPEGKAAVTRGTATPTQTLNSRIETQGIAAVRRDLKTLDDVWKKDSQPISFSPSDPEVLVYPITAP